MKSTQRFLSLLLTFSIVLSFIVFPISAASSPYETVKDNVPVWTQSNSSSTKVRTVKSQGTVLNVVSSTTNSHGNLWYKLDDGNWVFSGNVKKHYHTSFSFGTCLACGYICVHDYTGGICGICKYEWPYQTRRLDQTQFTVTNSDGAKIWSRPYSNNSTHVRTEAKGVNLTVVGKTTNEAGNLWYMLSDGNWVFSGNVKEKPFSYTITYHANGGVGTPAAQSHIQNTCSLLSNVTPTREGYIFLGWATDKNASGINYKSGDQYAQNANITLYAVWKNCSHKYKSASGDACILCGQFFEYTLTIIDKTMYAVKDNVPVRNAPYSGSGYVVKTLDQGDKIHISYSLENALGHPWYRTQDGSYIFADNLSATKVHTHSAVKTVKATKTYTYLNTSYHLVTETAAATLCSCGETIQGGTEENYTERHNSTRGGNCSLCLGSEVSISPTLYSTKKGVSVYSDLKTGSTARELKPGSLVTIVAIEHVSSASFTWGSSGRDPFTSWGKTVNGTWIPLEREQTGTLAKKSKISLPPKGVYEVSASSAPLRDIPASSAAIKVKLQKGQRVQITNTYYNDAGNQWGTTADGYEVYLGNLKHTGDEAQVILNGKVLNVSAPLLNENGRLLIPVRDIAEALGAHVSWNQASRTVVIQRGLDSVVLQIGNKKIYSGEITPLDVPAKLVKDRTYVPLRALSEMFGAEVGWIAGTKTATVNCPIPTAEAIISDFNRWEFYAFHYYNTFAAEHGGLSPSILHVIGNIGKFGEKIVVGGFENVYEAFIHNTYVEINPLDDYASDEIKASLKAIISAIPEIEHTTAVDVVFSEQYDNVKDLVTFVEEGGDFAHGEFKFKTKAMSSFCKKLELTLDLTKFSAESLEYIFTEYQRHLVYLDIVEKACGNSPDVANAVNELRAEYENKILGTLIKVQTKVLELAADEALGKIPLYKLTTLLVEGTFNILGVNEYSKNVLNSASTYIVTSNLVRYYSSLTSNCFNWSSGSMNNSVNHADWDQISAAFTLTKAAVLRSYKAMYGATGDSAVKVYLNAQMNVLNRIQIQSNISNTRIAPYYIQ